MASRSAGTEYLFCGPDAVGTSGIVWKSEGHRSRRQTHSSAVSALSKPSIRPPGLAARAAASKPNPEFIRDFQGAIGGISVRKEILDEGFEIRNCTASEIRAIQHAQRGLLRHEVEVLKPDVVVFFTGPSYDNSIQCAFPEAESYPLVPESPKSEIAMVNAPGLPINTIRTFHPVYLQRSRRWSTLSLIADWVQSQHPWL